MLTKEPTFKDNNILGNISTTELLLAELYLSKWSIKNKNVKKTTLLFVDITTFTNRGDRCPLGQNLMLAINL